MQYLGVLFFGNTNLKCIHSFLSQTFCSPVFYIFLFIPRVVRRFEFVDMSKWKQKGSQDYNRFSDSNKRGFYSHEYDSHYILLACCVEHRYNDVPFGTSQNQERLFGTFPLSITMIIIWKSSINNESVQIWFKELQRKLDWPKMLSETKYARTEKNTVMYFLVRS